jgi:hypothetical protein
MNLLKNIGLLTVIISFMLTSCQSTKEVNKSSCCAKKATVDNCTKEAKKANVDNCTKEAKKSECCKPK